MLILQTCSRPVWAAQQKTIILNPTDNGTADSANPSTNYPGSTYDLYALDYSCFLCSSRTIQSWLKFDLSSIPPGATITSATLTLALVETNVDQSIGVYGESNNAWTEGSLTWNNPGQGSVSSTYSSSNYVTNSTTIYSWNVQSLVAGGSPVSFVLQPTSSQGSSSSEWSVFYSSEFGGSSYEPSLMITYTYVSTSISLSSGSIPFGSSVTLYGTTDPSQTQGLFQLQYSTDQSTWYVIGTQSGGSASIPWTPPSVGTFYVRGAWTISWNSGADSYTANSAAQVLAVNQAASSVQLFLSQGTIVLGGQVTLSVTIGPNSVSDGTVTIQVSTDGVTWSTLAEGTPTSGAFYYVWLPNAAGTFYVRAEWSGDQYYTGSTSSESTLVVQKIPTSISIFAPSTSRLDQTVTIVATVLDIAGNPVSGGQVTFQFDSSIIGTVETGGSGSASVEYALTASAGIHTIVATYAGSSGYEPSTATFQMTIVPWKVDIATGVANEPLVDFDGQNYTSDSQGQITIPVNSSGTYSISVNSPLGTSAGVRVVLIQWTYGLSPASRTINVNSDLSLAITEQTQYFLSLQSEYGNPSGSGWFNAGSSAQISAQSPVDQGNGTRRVLTSWVEGTQSYLTSVNGSVSMKGPISLEGVWKKQYLVSAFSQEGTVSGGGWYDAGANATVSVSPTVSGFIIQQVFNGWQEGLQSKEGVSSFDVNGPVTLHASWRTDYTQLIILVALVGGGLGGVGGYSWFRKGRGKGEPIPPGPPTEPEGGAEAKEGARVGIRQELETGTSVYAPIPCPKCGLVNPVGATYCAYCGADLNPQ